MTQKTKLFLRILLCYSITIVTLPMLLILLAILYVYRKIAFAFIYAKHNPADVTTFNSEDTLFNIGEPHHNNVDIILVVNLKTGNVDDFVINLRRRMKETILKYPEKYPKLTSTLQQFMGYGYLLKTDIDLNECLVSVEVENEKSFVDMISFYANQKLPLNNRLLWQVVVFRGSDDWKKNSNLKVNDVPLLIRANHMIGDGLSLINMAVHNFSDNEVDINVTLKHFEKKQTDKMLNKFVQMLRTIHLYLLAPGHLLVNKFKSWPDVWDAPEIFNRRRLVFAASEDKDLVNDINIMRKKMKDDTTFTEIVLTGISASIQDYFSTMMPKVPQNILMVVVCVGDLLELNRPDGVPDLRNQICYGRLKLPISVNSPDKLNRLREIKKEAKERFFFDDKFINYFFLTHFTGLFPNHLLNALVPMEKITATFSNLTEVPKCLLWNGNSLDKVVFFTPLKKYLGMGFSVVTYDNRLHIGLAYDEVAIPSSTEAQRLVDGVLEYLEEFKKSGIKTE